MQHREKKGDREKEMGERKHEIQKKGRQGLAEGDEEETKGGNAWYMVVGEKEE